MTSRVRVEEDGTVVVMSGKVELGQGITTALAQIAADALGVPLEKIRMLPASTAYSPDEGVTSGSLSVSEGGTALRKDCEELAPLFGTKSPVLGRSVPRLDLPRKIAGRPSYLQDMVLPGMLHGRVVRPPFGFRKLVSIPEGEFVRDGSFVGVLAQREEDAIAMAAKVRAKAQWERSPEPPQDIHAWLKANVAETHVASDKGPLSRATLKAEYSKLWIAHASIGPSCAIARWTGKKLEVWSHTQGIFNLRRDLAMVLGMPEEDIVVTHAEGAGCYGHNGADDAALDAALLARAAGGRPVRLQWSREDEFAWEPYGAAMSVALEATLDAGRVVSWQHQLWSNGHTNRPGRAKQPTLVAAAHLAEPMALAPPVNPPLPYGGADRNAIPYYDFPAQRVLNHYVREAPVRSSSLRSLGAYANVFAIESFMDELALASEQDVVAFRLKHLKDERARKVIEEAIRKSSWGSFKKYDGAGHGLAFARYKNLSAYCAVVAEVEAGEELRVKRLVAAVDVGLAVNPDGVANQVEGGCIQAASWTLKEGATRPASSWEDYPILRFSEVPAVEVSVLRNDFPSMGAGECAMGPTAAAIANALHDALGVRVRSLPLTAENIVKAMP
ncbi:MAG TPA: molybdopterin cofactor-binding domain-containing protein [Burkholderiales bacterium]|nr:molybdopterin cofactor-binding domain-containing protein [Burkholderiales bacterium]